MNSPYASAASASGSAGARAAPSASSSTPSRAGATSQQPPVPQRSSSFATVVPATTPLDSTSNTADPFDKAAFPENPKEYVVPPSHTQLTPLRAHYLKRELVGGQLARELHALGNPDALSIVGWPFDDTRPPERRLRNARLHQERSTAKAAVAAGGPSSAGLTGRSPHNGGDDDDDADLPFLRFFLHHFVMTFPFLSQVDTKTFYSRKLQPFIESFMKRNISMNEEREEETGQKTKRHKLAGKAEKHLGLLISSAIRLNDNRGREEVVRIVDVKSAPVPPPSSSSSGAATSSATGQAVPGTSATFMKASEANFQVNVVGIRTVTYRNKLGRKTNHEEFLVRTSRNGQPDVFVSRRYGDFVRLAGMLRTEFPELDVRAPPPKDRRGVDAAASSSASPPGGGPNASATFDSDNNVPINEHAPPVILSRERNRVTLRAYLRVLLQTQEIANSAILRGFLTAETTTLTAAEEADAAKREEMDRLREAEADKFRSEVEHRVKELDKHLRAFKDDLVKKDGLQKVFGTIRQTKDYKDLPVEYQKVFEWARISLASTIYQLFLGSDNSSAMFSQFKRVHGLMPYFMMRQILRISNPVAMIRAGLDLFLARPFGSASLLQRMFSSGIEGEVKELKEDMSKVALKIEDDVLCERVRRFINSPREVQKRYRREAEAEDADILTVIMRSRDELFPPMSPSSLQRVHRASIRYKEYLDWVATLQDPDEEDEGPDNDDAWLFEDLHVYMRMAMRLRDKEQMLELIFEGSTSDLLKDIITIFYEPLARVYKAANIADSLYDLQAFLNDLVKTVEGAEANVNSSNMDPQRTVTIFMDLVQRHEAAFYNFVHSVHTKGEDLFDGLMHWIELFLNFIREGLNPSGIMLDFILPHGGKDREDIMREIDSLIDYHRTLKIAHHERLRRRLIKGEVAGAASYVTGSGVVGSPNQVGFGAPADRDGEAAFVGNVLQNLSLSGVADDIDDLNAEVAEEEGETDEDDEDAGSDEFVDALSDSSDAAAGTTSRHAAGASSTASAGRTNNPYAALQQQQQAATTKPTNNPFSSYMTQTTLVVNLPPPNASQQQQQGGSGTNRKGGKNGKGRLKPTAIVEPELVHIPKLVPIFTEMLRPSLETAQKVQMLKAQQQHVKPNRSVQAAQAAIRR